MHLQSPLVQQYIQSITTGYLVENKQQQDTCFQYAPSSVYSIESEDEDDEGKEDDDKVLSVFEKTYVSFPDFSPQEDSKTVHLNESKVITAPSSYTHFKPIWMST